MALTRSDHDLRIDSPWSIGERSGLALLVALVPAILVADYVAGRQFSLHLFYLVPVALAAWNLGEKVGYTIAMATGASWAFVAIASRGPGDNAGAVAWDIGSTFAMYLFVAHLVARHRRYADGVRALARVDNETGALSRREFDRLFEAEVRRSKRYRRPVALVLFEVGEFKGESTGHVPAAVRAVCEHLREGDSVARLAERRFAALLIECPAPEAIAIAGRLREALIAALRLRPRVLAVGVATYGGKLPASAATLMALAENHVDLAKGGSGLAETRVD